MKHLLAIILFAIMLAKAGTAEIWVVAPQNYKSESIKLKDLRRLYMGYIQYHEDRRVTLTQIEGQPLSEFVDKFLKINVNAYQQKWYGMIFTGKGELPRTFKKDAELVAFIKTSENAIGFISSQESVIEGVKILTVLE